MSLRWIFPGMSQQVEGRLLADTKGDLEAAAGRWLNLLRDAGNDGRQAEVQYLQPIASAARELGGLRDTNLPGRKDAAPSAAGFAPGVGGVTNLPAPKEPNADKTVVIEDDLLTQAGDSESERTDIASSSSVQPMAETSHYAAQPKRSRPSPSTVVGCSAASISGESASAHDPHVGPELKRVRFVDESTKSEGSSVAICAGDAPPPTDEEQQMKIAMELSLKAMEQQKSIQREKHAVEAREARLLHAPALSYDRYVDLMNKAFDANEGLHAIEYGALNRAGNDTNSFAREMAQHGAAGGRHQTKAQYGRFTPVGCRFLADALDLGRSDSFFDFGFGFGTVLTQMALTRGCTANGIELLGGRVMIAEMARTNLLEAINQEFGDELARGDLAIGDCKELTQGDLSDDKVWPSARNYSVWFCNNFNDVFGSRGGSKDDCGPTLDYRLALEFASEKTPVGQIFVTLGNISQHFTLKSNSAAIAEARKNGVKACCMRPLAERPGIAPRNLRYIRKHVREQCAVCGDGCAACAAAASAAAPSLSMDGALSVERASWYEMHELVCPEGSVNWGQEKVKLYVVVKLAQEWRCLKPTCPGLGSPLYNSVLETTGAGGGFVPYELSVLRRGAPRRALVEEAQAHGALIRAFAPPLKRVNVCYNL